MIFSAKKTSSTVSSGIFRGLLPKLLQPEIATTYFCYTEFCCQMAQKIMPNHPLRNNVEQVAFMMLYLIMGHLALPVCFYPRDAMLARSLRQRRVRPSVCPSVRPSVTRRYCAQQSESRIVKCTPSDSQMILVSGKV